MFYQNELVQYRHLKFSSATNNGLQIFDKPKINQRKLKYRKYSDLVEKYASPSCCIHGIHYLWSKYKRSWERYFWVAVILSAFFGSTYWYSMFKKRHDLMELKTIVESTRIGVYSIDFPAIAVCPFNHVNTIRAGLAEERFLPRNTKANVRALFRNLTNGMEVLEFGAFDRFGRIENLRAELETLDKVISITKLATYLAFRCEELFVPECIFNNLKFDCCKQFVPERTDKGICFIFNSLISPWSKKQMISEEVYPRRAEKAGEGSGLKFALRLNKTFHRSENGIPFAMNIMIKEPLEWSETVTHIVYSNTHNIFAVDPRLTTTNENTRGMTPESRRCLFNNEKSKKFKTSNGLRYNKLNCRTHCMHEHLLKTCNCTIPLFFPDTPTKQPECMLSDYICIFKNRDIFSYLKTTAEDPYIKDARQGMNCDCVNNCEAIDYLIHFNAVKLQNRSVETISLDIYFASDFLTKYSKGLEHTRIDLYASFGGTLALFLGASIVSFVELFYYLLKLLLRAIGDRENIWNKIRRAANKFKSSWLSKSSKSVKSAVKSSTTKS